VFFDLSESAIVCRECRGRIAGRYNPVCAMSGDIGKDRQFKRWVRVGIDFDTVSVGHWCFSPVGVFGDGCNIAIAVLMSRVFLPLYLRAELLMGALYYIYSDNNIFI